MRYLALLVLAVTAQPPAQAQVRYHLGDDPNWANPSFDDSSWPLVKDGQFPAPPLQSDGFVWVRQRVTVPLGDAAVWLRMPHDWFPGPPEELWADGRLVGANGKLPPEPRIRIGAALNLFDLPKDLSGKAEVIAERIWVPPIERQGSLRSDVRIGPRDSIRLGALTEREDILRREAASTLVQALQTLLGILFLMAWRAMRGRPDARAFAAFFAFWALDCLWILLAQFLWPGMSAVQYIAVDFALYCVSIVALGCLIGAVFSVRVRFPLYLLITAQSLAWLAFEFSHIATQPLPFGALLASNWRGLLNLAAAAIILTLAARRPRNEWDQNLLAASLLLFELALAAAALQWTTDDVEIAGFVVPWTVLFETLLTATMAWVLFRGVWRTWVERQGLSAEFDAAREMQESLVQRLPATPGFAVDAAYRPASQVGGDFYRVLPAGDGAILVVVGDVSGKGLKAAMTVSAIAGALDNEFSRNPSEILSHLNRALLQHKRGGFVTCCAALMKQNGEVRIANAGHLAPYADGCELDVEAGLPLGVVPDVEYPESMAEGDRFTFLSDGVLEAANATHELFGFARSREISIEAAAAIAQAAQTWGQNDDITVVTVRRTA
jgi:hypothetical protein